MPSVNAGGIFVSAFHCVGLSPSVCICEAVAAGEGALHTCSDLRPTTK
ncbi:hypothetical protein [Xenorhabdus bovienii]